MTHKNPLSEKVSSEVELLQNNTGVGWRMISVTEHLLKFMTEAQEILVK
jgi:hypothetical protein